MSGLQQNVHVAEEAEGPQQESVLQGQTAVAGSSQYQLHEILNARRRTMLQMTGSGITVQVQVTRNEGKQKRKRKKPSHAD